MFTTILACIIANIILLAIFGFVAYKFYQKHETEIISKVEDIKETIKTVETSLESMNEIKTKIDELLDKLTIFKSSEKE